MVSEGVSEVPNEDSYVEIGLKVISTSCLPLDHSLCAKIVAEFPLEPNESVYELIHIVLSNSLFREETKTQVHQLLVYS